MPFTFIMTGKFCWEATALYNTEDSTMPNDDGMIDLPEWPLPPPPRGLPSSPQRPPLSGKQALRHRNPSILPHHEDTSDDLDNLDDLLQYIGHSSPECLNEPGRPLNAIISASHFLDPVMEKEMIAGKFFELRRYIMRRLFFLLFLIHGSRKWQKFQPKVPG